MSTVDATIHRELTAIARHEAGHTIVAAAIGCTVRNVYIRLRHGALVGMTIYSPPPSGLKRSEQVAIAIAGLLADTEFEHLRLSAPPVSAFAVPETPARSATSARWRQAITAYRFDALADPLAPGDLGQIQRILSGCETPDAIYRRGETLARKTLAANRLVIWALSQQLLSCGNLRGAPLQSLLAEIKLADIKR